MKLFWALLLLSSAYSLFAQPVLIPLHSKPISGKICKSLSLPFFDDFAAGVDTNWLDNRGVRINNSLSLRAPSIFVASFDGADERGVPYNFAEPAKVGYADSLVSQCFDLNKFSIADSLIISFFIQAGGYGEKPNEEDSLILFAKNSQGTWKKIWSASPDSVIEFKKVDVKLADTGFFHSNFQFGFANIARTSGPFDVWNLDYVYFYSKKQDNRAGRFDIAVASPFARLFGKYRAMPLQQFRARPIVDTTFVEIANLSQELKLIAHPVILRQYEEVDSVLFEVREQQVETFSTGTFQSDQSTNLIESGERLRVSVPLEFSWMRGDLDSCWVEAEIALNTQENNQIIRTTLNDTLRYRAAIKDYYAYDDGTAEYGIGMRQRFGRFAVRFVLEREALLTDIDLYMPRIGINQEGQIYRICVWKYIDMNDTKKDKLLFVQTRTVQYGEQLDKFQRLNLIPENPKFEELLILEDTFYIGIQQLTEELMPLGFDENTDSQTEIFFNIGSKWEKNSNIPGSIMIRPVFRRNAVNVGLAEDLQRQSIPYPNPAKKIIHIDNQDIVFARIMDLQGRVLMEAELNQTREINVEHLSEGMYLLELLSPSKKFVFKIVKE